MPRKPKLMFQICQNDNGGFFIVLPFVYEFGHPVLDYPLTLPSVSPDTSHLLSERKRITTGMDTITDAAP